MLVRALQGLADSARIESVPDRDSLWAGLFDLRENLLDGALDDLRALAASAPQPVRHDHAARRNEHLRRRVDQPRPRRHRPAPAEAGGDAHGRGPRPRAWREGRQPGRRSGRLGAEVRFVGAVGDDDFGREATAELHAVGVDLSGLQVTAPPTGIALILVDEAGENQIVVVPGANHALDPAGIDPGKPDALVCQLELLDEPILAALGQTDAFFCLNAAPARPVPEAILGAADLIVANSLELEALGSSPMGALFALTLGAEGRSCSTTESRWRARRRRRRGRRRDGGRGCLHGLPRRLPARGARPRGGR